MIGKKIAVVLAQSKNFSNTGMFSVDYAAYVFFKENFPDCELNFYVFNLNDKKYYPGLYETIVPYSTYNEITEEKIAEIRKSDLIVYWSDFFHTRHFLNQYMEEYVFRNMSDPEKGKDIFFQAFFHEGADDSIFDKTFCFGTSMMFIDEGEPSDLFMSDRYAKNLKNLYSRIRFSMPRDKVSFSNLKKMFGPKKIRQGCDAAFLIGRHNRELSNKKLGLFIGRRTEIKIKDVIEVVKFAKENGLKVEWISWMRNVESLFIRSLKNPRQAKNLFLHFLLSKIFGPAKHSFMGIADFSMIVTDTYHLSINAIRNNVPVFCIGSDSIIYNKNSLDLHDKKKRVLFEMIDSPDSYGSPTSCNLICTYLKGEDQAGEYIEFVNSTRLDLKSICSMILSGY